ncbi:FAD binding domain-containing protein [Pelobacter propionicus]|uniref:Molybdopterin dehydrogenase, FAD-binding protein n=1 Tax=Pelobacter propionicus (strain DSM 2379 / NBRC 103807 / OttBd1) TaxID=338966 RepID=A1ANZ0_PELPD|nr:FAD binding domain-containing protein [Pelobacter propionicus]ABK99060.1 molybdopterin dehydrogenase, FAD-binding protein [Pelobacter propionicus DSM 2379]
MVGAFRPQTLQQALDIRGSRMTTLFAGGSDLMVRHRSWSGIPPALPAPALMIGHIEELRNISADGDTLRIGACATLGEILGHPAVPDYVRLPLSRMASPSIRAIATLGGNIANASPAGDSLPMLYALDARLELRSCSHTEEVDVADFIGGPGRTILEDDQILTRIHIPLAQFTHLLFEKVAGRRANSIAKLSLYVVARISGPRVEEVRVAFGAVAPTVVRNREAEALLARTEAAHLPGRVEQVKACYAPLITPIDDQRSTREYRRDVALGLLERFLLGLR